MGFLFSWTSKVILNIAAFIVFYCLHDCFKGFLCFSQKIMQRIFCDVFLEIIVYAQTKMLFDEWIDVWYSIHNASFRVESFAKKMNFSTSSRKQWMMYTINILFLIVLCCKVSFYLKMCLIWLKSWELLIEDYRAYQSNGFPHSFVKLVNH